MTEEVPFKFKKGERVRITSKGGGIPTYLESLIGKTDIILECRRLQIHNRQNCSNCRADRGREPNSNYCPRHCKYYITEKYGHCGIHEAHLEKCCKLNRNGVNDKIQE